MSKTAERVSELKIPKFMRKRFFALYSRYYGVKIDEMVKPLGSY